MKTDIETQLHRLKKECPKCLGDGTYEVNGIEEIYVCPGCSGTGEVLRFPKLSRECQGSAHMYGLGEDHTGHHFCGGTGRVANLTLEGVLEAAESEGFKHVVFWQTKDGYFCQLTDWGNIEIQGLHGDIGASRLEATVRALERLVSEPVEDATYEL